MGATYPSGIWVPTENTAVGQTIQPAYFNDPYNEIIAVETGLLNGFQHPLKWLTDNAHDIGTSGANRPRNLYLATDLLLGSSTINNSLKAVLGTLAPQTNEGTATTSTRNFQDGNSLWITQNIKTLNGSTQAITQDSTSAASRAIRLNLASGTTEFWAAAAGGTSLSLLFTIDASGNLIPSGTATLGKSSAVWAGLFLGGGQTITTSSGQLNISQGGATAVPVFTTNTAAASLAAAYSITSGSASTGTGVSLVPKRSGVLLITATAELVTVGTSNAIVLPCYNTTGIPAQGAAISGTQGPNFGATISAGNNLWTGGPWLVTGLTLGTTYYFYLALSTGGSSGQTVTIEGGAGIAVVEL